MLRWMMDFLKELENNEDSYKEQEILMAGSHKQGSTGDSTGSDHVRSLY